ncbi:MAG: response regulator [Bdellovibrionota bacterium]|nr:response regulator [Bdellovibrionota bacterium]|tara:strand:- start:17055 stop:17453 length:399 start_codon:yes stop_codon:yes gene_type:complete
MEDNERETLKIVVVEDSNLARKAIIDTLEQEGFEVVGEAPSAEEAMTLLQSSGCNCLIIDIVMPEISGIELAQALNELKNKVTIIMMSSLKQEDIIIESIAVGAVDFLQKPFEKETLIKSVKKAEQDLEIRS